MCLRYRYGRKTEDRAYWMTFLLLRRQKVSVQHFNTSTTRLAESVVFLAQDNLIRLISISRESLNRNDLCTVAQQKNRSAMRTCVAYELPWSQRFFLPLRGSGSLILCREKSRKSSVTGVLNSPFFTYHWNPVDSVTKI